MTDRMPNTTTRGLLDRLSEGAVVIGEGYLFELERRGYLQAGSFVPEVVLDHPEVVEQVHRDFTRAGSEIQQACTYYGIREKMRIVGKEHKLEPLNRDALRIAAKVAHETGTLLAGNICNTNVYDPNDAATVREARSMFEEQVQWAAEEGADLVIAETYDWTGEAMMALETIQKHGLGAVITFAMHQEPATRDGDSLPDACKKLEDAGADVVGLNCMRGPWTMLNTIREVGQRCTGHVAALPVPYRTTEEEPTFTSLSDHKCPVHGAEAPFPTALDPFLCNRYEIAEFAREAHNAGVSYLGLCCGCQPHLLRAMAEALGRQPPASAYSPDMSKHAFLGEVARDINKQYTDKF